MHLRQLINWEGLIFPSIMHLKTGNFLTTLRYLPADLESASEEQLDASAAALNSAIMRFDNQWSLWFECLRAESVAYDDSEWPDPVSAMLDSKRREYFETQGNQLENFYFASFEYKPSKSIDKLVDLYIGEGRKTAADELRMFRSVIESFQTRMSTFCPRVEPLVGDDLVTYLRACITGRFKQLRMPSLPILDCRFLIESNFDNTDPKDSKLGDEHIKTIKIHSQPGSYIPAVLDILNNAPFPLRNVSRFQPWSIAQARGELEKRRNLWIGAITSLGQIVSSGLKRKSVEADPRKSNLHAESSSDVANIAIAALDEGECIFGEWVHTVTVQHHDLNVVRERVRWVETAIQNLSFSCGVASHFDAMPAWLGSLPGHSKWDLGRLLMGSLNFAKVLPSSAPWTGDPWDHYLDGPPLLRAVSNGGTPFKFCLYEKGSTLAHVFIDGRGGSGKSVFIGAMIAAHRKYKGAREIIIDYLGSAKGITLALGGEFHDLANPDSVSLQPLSSIDDLGERRWAHDYIVDRLAYQGLVVSSDQKIEIAECLDILAEKPEHRRTITNFHALVQDKEIWSSLAPYVQGGSCGHIIDNDTHRLGTNNDVTCFEMATLLRNDTAAEAAFPIIFHEIEKKLLDGRPTLLSIDEAQVHIRYKAFRERLFEWLETARKRGCVVVMATPDLAAFAKNDLSSLIERSFATCIYGANPSALKQANKKLYLDLGLTEEQIKIISQLQPAREYVWSRGLKWRRGELALSETELAFYGKNSTPDRKLMDVVLASGPREEYAQRWLEALCLN